MTPREFNDWMLYEKLEPFGDLRADYHAAQVSAMVHNSPRAKEDQRPLEDFLLKFGEKKQKPQQTVKEQALILNLLAEAMGG